MNAMRIAQKMTILVTLVLLAGPGQADESKYELGLRGNVLLGDGVPSNDILGAWVIGRYSLDNGWFIGAGLDAYEYDFERPWRIVDLRQDPNVDVIDAAADSSVLSGSFGRLYSETDHGFDWFWTLGVGFASPDVEDVAGPTDTGGTFDLMFDVGDEIHLMASLGTTYNFSASWSASFAARIEHHFMDVLITDRISGNTAKIDSQSPIGASISLNFRF